MKTQYLKAFTSTVLILGLGVIFATTADAWTGATANPPLNNVAAPIHVGSDTQTKAGVLNVNGLRSYVDIIADGKVGIGTTNPGYPLSLGSGLGNKIALWEGTNYLGQQATHGISIANDTDGKGSILRIAAGDEGSNVGIGGIGVGYNDTLLVNGQSAKLNGYFEVAGSSVFNQLVSMSRNLIVNQDIQAADFITTSDASLKKDIKPLENSLSNVKKLQGVSYKWKESGKEDIGLIAQDVEKVYPELVHTNPETGLKAVEYSSLVAPLIEAIKEQQKEIESLRTEIEALKN